MMKRVLSVFFIAISMCFFLCAHAMAVKLQAEPTVTGEERAEETEWFYRYHDGKLQKRLWSVTYEKWLTDWMDYYA